jgi:hypothetical protein
MEISSSAASAPGAPRDAIPSANFSAIIFFIVCIIVLFFLGKSESFELGFEGQISASAPENFLVISAYYFKNFPRSYKYLRSQSFKEPSSLDFCVDFGTWRLPPSVYFARATSAESAKKQGFRAGSNDSLLPIFDSLLYNKV